LPTDITLLDLDTSGQKLINEVKGIIIITTYPNKYLASSKVRAGLRYVDSSFSMLRDPDLCLL